MSFLFYGFATLAVLAAIGVVCSKEGLQAVLMMLLSLLSLAGLFVLLEAYLLAALQVWVYAGAIMVLFVFMIMLLGKAPTEPQGLGLGKRGVLAGAVGLGTLTGVFACMRAAKQLLARRGLPQGLEEIANPDAFTPQAHSLASLLFSKYLLPLEIVAFLLLGTLVAVLALTRPPAASEKPPS